MLFLGAAAVSPRMLGAEFVNAVTTAPPIAAADFQQALADAPFANYRLELGGAKLRPVSHFGDDAPSPLFSTAADSANSHEAGVAASEWDYLWRNASRIPITAIPEPTVGALLLGSALWFGAQRLAAGRTRR